MIYNKPPPLAPLELTIEAEERIAANGDVLIPLNEAKLRGDLATLSRKGIEALTVSLFNAYVDGKIDGASLKSRAKSCPRSRFRSQATSSRKCTNTSGRRRPSSIPTSDPSCRIRADLERELAAKMRGVQLHILRSDGGLSSALAARDRPVNLLMSGPAGGVAGAVGIATRAGFAKLLTFDMAALRRTSR